MLIDWFTVGAQALNFLILVWLLKRFLYQPILHAIDEREKRVAAELANADEKRAEAAQEREQFQRKNEELDQQRAALLSQATKEVKVERQRLLDAARQEAEILSTKRRETLRIDAHNLNQALQHKTQQEVFAIARKALTDLASTSLEERMAAVLIQRLHALDAQARTSLAAAITSKSSPTLVRSTFDIPFEIRSLLQKAINEAFAADIKIQFETAPELVGGIELSANGQKVAWSIDDYLDSLENGVQSLLNGQDKLAAKSEVEGEEPDAATKGQ